MSLELLLSIGSILLSIAIALRSYYEYKKYDERIKQQEISLNNQQRQINEYKLCEAKNKEIILKSASLSFDVEPNKDLKSGGYGVLRLINKGCCEATNIEVLFDKHGDYYVELIDFNLLNGTNIGSNEYVDCRFSIEPCFSPCTAAYSIAWNDANYPTNKRPVKGKLSFNI